MVPLRVCCYCVRSFSVGFCSMAPAMLGVIPSEVKSPHCSPGIDALALKKAQIKGGRYCR